MSSDSYSDPKLLAQMALTHMVQKSHGGRTVGESKFCVDREHGEMVLEALNAALGSVCQASFHINENGHVEYSGPVSLHIPHLLKELKKSTYGTTVRCSLEEQIRSIISADLGQKCGIVSASNDGIKPDATPIVQGFAKGIA